MRELPEWADAPDTEPGTIECPTDPGDVRWCACGQPWLPAVGLNGTTDETQCQACTLRRLLRKAMDTIAAERAKRCETCAYGHREDAGMVCNNDTYPGCLFDMAVPDNFCCTLWEARTIDIEAAAEFVRE